MDEEHPKSSEKMDRKDEGKEGINDSSLVRPLPSGLSSLGAPKPKTRRLPLAKPAGSWKSDATTPRYENKPLGIPRSNCDSMEEIEKSARVSEAMPTHKRGPLAKLDVNEIDTEGPKKKGFLSGIVHGMKNFLGIPEENIGPNVKVEVLQGLERDTYLEEMCLSSEEKLMSDIYRVLELEDDLAPDGELIAPIDMTLEAVQMHVFHFCIKTTNGWQKTNAEYQSVDGCVHGVLVKMAAFSVVGGLRREVVTVGPEGFTYVSEADARVSVDFPPGAVEEQNKFEMTLDAPKNDRLKAYREYLPNMFEFVSGCSSILKVDYDHKHCLKRKARVTLPVSLESEAGSDQEVIFFSCQGDAMEQLGAGRDSENETYSIDVSHFSDINAFRVRPSIPQDLLLEAVKYLTGQLSLCTMLTFVAFNYIETMPAIVCDCVESVDGRPEKIAEEYRLMDLQEIRLSRSRAIPMENNCRIKVELGGNLKLAPKVSPSILNMHFLQYSRSNRVVIPVRRIFGQQSTSIVTFRGPRNRWEHPVHFVLSPDQCGRNLKPNQTRVPEKSVEFHVKSASHPNLPRETANSKPPQTKKPTIKTEQVKTTLYKRKSREDSTSDVPVFSQQSLNALSDVMASPSDWRRVGIELGVRNDDITRLFKQADDTSSLPALELLLYWQRTSRGDAASLIEELSSAFTEIDRGDVAGELQCAFEDGRRLTRDDFRN